MSANIDSSTACRMEVMPKKIYVLPQKNLNLAWRIFSQGEWVCHSYIYGPTRVYPAVVVGIYKLRVFIFSFFFELVMSLTIASDSVSTQSKAEREEDYFGTFSNIRFTTSPISSKVFLSDAS